MQAILTKYLPPTNTKPSRYKAECERGSLTVSADYALNLEENHRAVCDALCARFDAEDTKQYGSTQRTWNRPKAGGAIPSGEYVFCFIQPRVLDRDALVKAVRECLPDLKHYVATTHGTGPDVRLAHLESVLNG